MEFTIIVFAWPLPDYHNVYKSFCRSIRNISISDLINNVSAKYLCPGVDGVKSSNIISHVVPCEVDLQDDNWHENPFQTRGYERSKTCFVIHDENHQPCLNCEHSAKISKCKSKALTPARLKAPLSKTNPERIILTLKEQRKENKELQDKIKIMEKELMMNSVAVDDDLNLDFNKIMSDNGANISPFMKLFWDQQQKLFGKGKGARYHPMIIRFCLSLASKSASAYDELRSSNILTLV